MPFARLEDLAQSPALRVRLSPREIFVSTIAILHAEETEKETRENGEEERTEEKYIGRMIGHTLYEYIRLSKTGDQTSRWLMLYDAQSINELNIEHKPSNQRIITSKEFVRKGGSVKSRTQAIYMLDEYQQGNQDGAFSLLTFRNNQERVALRLPLGIIAKVKNRLGLQQELDPFLLVAKKERYEAVAMIREYMQAAKEYALATKRSA